MYVPDLGSERSNADRLLSCKLLKPQHKSCQFRKALRNLFKHFRRHLTRINPSIFPINPSSKLISSLTCLSSSHPDTASPAISTTRPTTIRDTLLISPRSCYPSIRPMGLYRFARLGDACPIRGMPVLSEAGVANGDHAVSLDCVVCVLDCMARCICWFL